MGNTFISGNVLWFCVVFLITQASFVQKSEPSQSTLSTHLKNARENKEYGRIAYYSYELGKLFYDQNKFEQAQEYLDEAISNAKKADDFIIEYLAYQLDGSIYLETNDASKASNQFQRSLKAAQEINREEYIVEALIDLSKTYILQNRAKRSVPHLEEALSLSIRNDDIITQLDCYELLVEVYDAQGNSEKANEYQALYDNIIKNKEKASLTDQQLKQLENQVKQADQEKRSVRHKLSNQSKALRKTEDSLLATKYSLEATEQSLKLSQQMSENQKLQIELLNTDKELNELRIKDQNEQLKYAALTRNFIIVGVLLAGALVLVTILGYKRKLKANQEINRQNKSIQSSINYAKRIQEAMLHRNDVFKELVPESFVLYKPRDVVSGDFYWISEIKNWYDPDIVISAVDCTGHGIPGAFMSMIGMNALNGIISQGIAESNQILNTLDKEIKSALQQDQTGNKDGMDIALCIYRKEKDIVEFSGAKNPLIYIQNNELHQIKGDRNSIGGGGQNNEQEFTKHTVVIDQPTTFYIYSDGYQDQFGEVTNKKFMTKKFKQLLFDIHQLPMHEQKTMLDQKIEEWRGSGKQTDDILVIGFKLDVNFED